MGRTVSGITAVVFAAGASWVSATAPAAAGALAPSDIQLAQSSAKPPDGRWAGYLISDGDRGCGQGFQDEPLPATLRRKSGKIAGAVRHLGDLWKFDGSIGDDDTLSLWMRFSVQGLQVPNRFRSK